MSNSRIIIENGTLRVGIDCGYTGGLCIDPRKDNCRIHLDNSTLRIIGDVGLFPGCRIWARGGEIAIGNGTILNPLSHIMARGRIEIGEQCLIASGVIIRDNDGHKLAIGDDKPTDILKNIVIKNHCWIGHNAIILKGVTIGEGAVVAAGSVVTKDVKERTLVAGVPAKTIQENVVWEA
jgi:acetyltransferase-like isoleucine patch superfamily enzyme